jgi:carboxyl-terminal processing protease
MEKKMSGNKQARIIVFSLVFSVLIFACQTISPNEQIITETPEQQVVILPTPTVEIIEDHLSPLDENLEYTFEAFWEGKEFIQENYVIQPVLNNTLAQGAIDGIVAGFENLGFDATDTIVPETSFTVEELSDLADTPKNSKSEFVGFWTLWQKAQYVAAENDITAERMMQFALMGMTDSLGDLHSSYIDPQQYHLSQVSLDNSYEGIGAWVDVTTEYLSIISPMPESPAENAGLLPGDEIIAIDGEDMTGIDGSIVITHVLGPAGSKVTLTIIREGTEAPFDVEVTRQKINVPTVQHEILDNNIAYLHLFNFGSESSNQVHEALKELMAENPIGLILDLRFNGGGYLTAAVQISSEFIEDGVILIEKFGDGTTETYNALSSNGLATEIPFIILVDEGSASASEILAGAVQDHSRGILVGQTTYGKGSVQIPTNLSNNQGSIRVTIAKWFTPNETQIHGIGLEPDFIVEFTLEDAEAGIDPQLEKAIELLLDQ